MKLKGKRVFTSSEIEELKRLIKIRLVSDRDEQKSIRSKMRKLGFYGEDDWGIRDMKLADLDSLIKSGRITVISDAKIKPIVSNIIEECLNFAPKDTTSVNTYSIPDLLSIFQKNFFDPAKDDGYRLPDNPGNYLVCLKEGASLPSRSVQPIFWEFSGLGVIYTGIASKSLRCRDYKSHFYGSAGRSTLRKSIGVLFGYALIPRDSDPATGKTKFNNVDEGKLSKWMCESLLLFYYPNSEYSILESSLIDHFHPPLNLQGCRGEINSEFRNMLSSLRSNKKM